MTSSPGYEGGSAFLRWSPKAFLVFAVLILASRWNHSVQFATLFCLLAYIHARWLACHFCVYDEGVLLTFPFGRRKFLSKESMRIRIEMVGAIALLGRHRRFGYPLMDSILYQPNHEETMRRVFTARGYDVA